MLPFVYDEGQVTHDKLDLFSIISIVQKVAGIVTKSAQKG